MFTVIRLQNNWAWGLYHETKSHEWVVSLFHLSSAALDRLSPVSFVIQAHLPGLHLSHRYVADLSSSWMPFLDMPDVLASINQPRQPERYLREDRYDHQAEYLEENEGDNGYIYLLYSDSCRRDALEVEKVVPEGG